MAGRWLGPGEPLHYLHHRNSLLLLLDGVNTGSWKSLANLQHKQIRTLWLGSYLVTLPQGVTLFAGRPKLGKSWLALDWCLAVACRELHAWREMRGRATFFLCGA